jgi:uncharacterized C2H2 Zn-finger protein
MPYNYLAAKKQNSKYKCILCDYYTSNKKDYNRHINTKKHITCVTQNIPNDVTKNPESIVQFIKCKQCDKIFNNRMSLWRHSKKFCSEINSNTNDLEEDLEKKELLSKDIILELIKQNKELQNVLLEQTTTVMEQNQKLFEMTKQVSLVNNITNNTTNNTQFNLQFFLNETCKGAMNIADFVNSLQVQIDDLEKTGKLGYVEGISGIFLRGLRELDYTMRPIHCTDLKRETVYVKDENSWEKDDDEKAKLKLAIQRVARKNMRTLPKWQEENPDFKILDTKENDAYMKIALNSMGGQTDDEHEKYVEKIMRNVLKEVVIEKK